MGRIGLRQITVSNDIFNKILESFPSYVEVQEDLRPYYCGYQNKNIIYFNGNDYLICTESVLNFVCPMEEYTHWKQVIIRKMPTQTKDIEQDVTGTYAYNYMMRVIKTCYSDEEVDNILHSYDTPYDNNKKQYHDIGWYHKGVIECWDNCYKFDINGAHTDALIDVFPKAKEKIIRLHDKRHTDVRVKKFFNYFVGMLKHKGYEGVYNYIVQRTTKKLLDAIDYVGGYVLYANTDGFVVQNPSRLLDTSKLLGEFKLEFKGTAYTYKGKNYWAIQTNDLKGNILSEAREGVDLSKGIVVNYDIIRTKFGTRKAVNIKKETLYENCYQNVG